MTEKRTLAQRLDDVERAMTGPNGLLRAAEQDARAQDAILAERIKECRRWTGAAFVLAAVAVFVAVVVAIR